MINSPLDTFHINHVSGSGRQTGRGSYRCPRTPTSHLLFFPHFPSLLIPSMIRRDKGLFTNDLLLGEELFCCIHGCTVIFKKYNTFITFPSVMLLNHVAAIYCFYWFVFLGSCVLVIFTYTDFHKSSQCLHDITVSNLLVLFCLTNFLYRMPCLSIPMFAHVLFPPSFTTSVIVSIP